MPSFPLPAWFFHATRRLLWGLIWLATGWRVEGLQHVPPTGSLVVVSNHLSNGDPFLISVALPRPVAYMGKVELFRVPVLAQLLRLFGTFPIERGGADRQAMRQALAILAAGHAVGMFPEGTRSRQRAMARGLPGAGLLVARSGATVLPVGIFGSERPRLWPRPTVTIRFGPPLTFAVAARGRLDHQAVVDGTMQAIARLVPTEYRGAYADQPVAVGAGREDDSR